MKALLWRLCDVFWIFNIFIKKIYIHIYIWCLCLLRYTTEKAQCWRGQEHPWYHMISLLSCYFKNTTLHTCSIRRSHDLWVYSLRLVTYSNSSMTYTHTRIQTMRSFFDIVFRNNLPDAHSLIMYMNSTRHSTFYTLYNSKEERGRGDLINWKTCRTHTWWKDTLITQTDDISCCVCTEQKRTGSSSETTPTPLSHQV